MLFDSHCHLEPGREQSEITDRAVAAGVTDLLNVGIDLVSSLSAQALCRSWDRSDCRIHYAAGLHPNSAGQWDAEATALAALCGAEDCVAVGETGLDFHWDGATPIQQERAFAAQLILAIDLNKPVIVHSRDAHSETFRILREHRDSAGVIHCFSGGVAEARLALDLGFYLSFAGNLTYPRSDALRAAAVFAPADRILVETDAPFLAPQPVRGRTNEPRYLTHTVDRLAEIRGEDPAATATTTAANARRLFDPSRRG